MRAQTLARPFDQELFTSSVAMLLFWAGLIHLVIAVLYGGHGAAHDGFHLLAFGSQQVCAAMLWQKPSRRRVQVALVLVGSLLSFYALVRIWPGPFPVTAEDVGIFGISSEACEALAGLILAALLVLSNTARGGSSAVWPRLLTTLWSAAMLGGLAYGVASAAPAPAPAATILVAPAAAKPVPVSGDHFYWMSGGVPRPFWQGAEVSLAGDMVARAAVNRSTEQPVERDVYLQLYRTTADNVVDDAEVTAIVHMGNMEHGTFTATALHSAGGQYVLPLTFSMPGEWQVDIDINRGAEQSSLHLWLDLLN